MVAEVKTAWINALRSGKFRPGIGTLRGENNDYCCLGVLCEVHRCTTNEDSWIQNACEGHWMYGTVEGYYLPKSVMIWAGLLSNDPAVNSPDNIDTTRPDNIDTTRLSIINDNGFSFSHIADIIERDL